jgi:hypothetical protein
VLGELPVELSRRRIKAIYMALNPDKLRRVAP